MKKTYKVLRERRLYLGDGSRHILEKISQEDLYVYET